MGEVLEKVLVTEIRQAGRLPGPRQQRPDIQLDPATRLHRPRLTHRLLLRIRWRARRRPVRYPYASVIVAHSSVRCIMRQANGRSNMNACALPDVLRSWAGEIVDVDSHEMMPAQVWRREFGALVDPLVHEWLNNGQDVTHNPIIRTCRATSTTMPVDPRRSGASRPRRPAQWTFRAGTPSWMPWAFRVVDVRDGRRHGACSW